VREHPVPLPDENVAQAERRKFRVAGLCWLLLAVLCLLLTAQVPIWIAAPRPLRPHKGPPPVALASRLAAADLAIASLRFHRSCRLITGPELQELIQGLSLATNATGGFRYGDPIQFYRGTNLLATIECGRPLRGTWAFRCPEGLFIDRSGQLRVTYADFFNDRTRIDTMRRFASETLRGPDLPRVREWCLEALARCRAGTFQPEFRPTVPAFRLREEAMPRWLGLVWPVPPSEVLIRKGASGEPECAILEWNEGPSLIVGPTDYVPAPAFPDQLLTNIAAGVYVGF